MSHQVQLSAAVSHCPAAVLDPAGAAAEPLACSSRGPYSRPDMRWTVPPWESDLHGHRSHPRQRFPGEPWIGTAGPVRVVLPLSAGRPDLREEGSAKDTAGNLCAACVPGHPDSDLPARLVPAIACELPHRYLPSTSRRPAQPSGAGQPPTTTSAHPILPLRGRKLPAVAADTVAGRDADDYAFRDGSSLPPSGRAARVTYAVHTCSPSAVRTSVLVVTTMLRRMSRMPVTRDSAWSSSPARIGRA